MEPDDGTGLDLHRYAIYVTNPSCQLELLLLPTFEVIVFEDITFVMAFVATEMTWRQAFS